jgi:long-subunit fatty acid transport protein
MNLLRKYHSSFLVIALFLFSSRAAAQYIGKGLGSWNIVNMVYNIDKKWSVFAEAQLRSLQFYDDFHYHEYKAGVNYRVHPYLRLTLAAGKYDTYREGGNFVKPKNNDEIRIWPQVIMQHNIGRFRIEQRYRAEFRFTSNGYRNRFRYRLGVSKPFGKERNGFRPFQISASNELFFTDKEPYFERNRLAFNFNYRFNKQTSCMIGYLHQFDYKINDETGRDFLQVGLYFELFRKEKK